MKVERLRLDAETETKEFYKWLMENSLTAKEISLWHALMYVADEAGYPVWLSIAISRMEKLTGMKKDSIYKARDKLEELGRIEILEGQGNQAAQYRIISFTTEYIEDEPMPMEAEETIEQPPIDPIEEMPEGPEERVNIFRRTQQLIPMPPSADIQLIKQFLDEGMEDKLLCEAVDITLKNEELRRPMDKWKYFKGIIRNWYNNGTKTFEEYERNEIERKERMNGGSSKRNHKKAKPGVEFKESGIRDFRIPD